MSVVSSPDPLNLQPEAPAPFTSRDVWIYLLVFGAYFFSARIDLNLVHLAERERNCLGSRRNCLGGGFVEGQQDYSRHFPGLIPGGTHLRAVGAFCDGHRGRERHRRSVGRLSGESFCRRSQGFLQSHQRSAILRACRSAGHSRQRHRRHHQSRPRHWLPRRGKSLATLTAWWAGHALGVLVVTPFLVLLLDGAHHPLHLNELAEIAALLVGLSIVCVISFGPPGVFTRPGGYSALSLRTVSGLGRNSISVRWKPRELVWFSADSPPGAPCTATGLS